MLNEQFEMPFYFRTNGSINFQILAPTSGTVPLASTIRTRSGSAAAIAW
jgi:hypothetical protein